MQTAELLRSVPLFKLLETLAATVADELKRRFPVGRVVVRIGKPGVELEGGRATVVAAR